MPKTRRQKQTEALARREQDLAMYERLLRKAQADLLAGNGKAQRSIDDMTTTASRALYDVKRLKIALGAKE